MVRRYAGIFGLTGSVGGKAELNYLRSTYSAVKFDVPRFLDTCIGDTRKEVTNHGVEMVDGEAAQIARVVEVSREVRTIAAAQQRHCSAQTSRLVASTHRHLA